MRATLDIAGLLISNVPAIELVGLAIVAESNEPPDMFAYDTFVLVAQRLAAAAATEAVLCLP